MKKIIFAVLGAAVIASCGPEIPTGSESAYVLDLSASSTLTGKTQSTTLTEAKAYVHGFKLFANEWDTAMSNVDIEGPFYVDLISGVSTPVIPTTGIASGLYRGISVHLGQRGSHDTSSLYIVGEKDGAAFVVDVTHPLHLMYKADSAGFQVDPNTISNFTVYLDLAGTIDAVDFSGAVADSTGIIRINKDSNKDVYRSFLEEVGARGEHGERHVGHSHRRGRGRGRG